jgi:hypothetical protein
MIFHPDELDADEFRRLKEILYDAQENSDRLSDWECGFVDDTIERLIQYDRRIRVTEKQMEIIDRIEQKLYG